jgi:hypothetical protein
VDQTGVRPVYLGKHWPAEGYRSTVSEAFLQRVAQSINAAHINAEDRFLTLASLCTIVGVRDTITALLAGAGIYILDPQRAGAREILNVVRDEAIYDLVRIPGVVAFGATGMQKRGRANALDSFESVGTRHCGATWICCAPGSFGIGSPIDLRRH